MNFIMENSLRQILKTRMKHDNVPLPENLHITLTEESLGDRDVFLVGDVHGCLDELQELLDKAGASTSENCLIILVGDVINKGPKNRETLAFVRELQARGKAVSVRGNHEENVVHQWMNFITPGYKPKKRYRYDWCEKLSREDIDFLLGWPYTISLPSLNAVVVHAGLVPGRQLEKQYPVDMVNMRNLLDELDENRLPIATDRKECGSGWAQLWTGPQHVYFGHDARRGLQLHKFATGLDTACVKGHKLTGVFVKGPRASEFVHVKAKDVYDD